MWQQLNRIKIDKSNENQQHLNAKRATTNGVFRFVESRVIPAILRLEIVCYENCVLCGLLLLFAGKIYSSFGIRDLVSSYRAEHKA